MTSSLAFGINSYGQVVGSGDMPQLEAFLWSPSRPNSGQGSMTIIGGVSQAISINSYGQVVGCSGTCGTPSETSRLWTPTAPNGTNGSWSNFSLNGGLFIEARGINAQGQVVLNSENISNRVTHLWTPTAPNGTTGAAVSLGDLPPAPNHSRGFGINSYGQVVGGANLTFASESQAYLWTPTAPNGTAGSMQSIAGPGSFGWAVNDMGQVVGGGLPNIAFLWTPNTPNGTTGSSVFLGRLPGAGSRTEATAINSQGDVVGTNLFSGPSRAFLWRPTTPNGTSGAIVDLNTYLSSTDASRWVLATARGINDFGQIVGWGRFDPDGPGAAPSVLRGYLLTPVPEPSAICLAVVCSISACMVPRRKRRRIAALR
jgi:uncharacterized membrane protein